MPAKNKREIINDLPLLSIEEFEDMYNQTIPWWRAVVALPSKDGLVEIEMHSNLIDPVTKMQFKKQSFYIKSDKYCPPPILKKLLLTDEEKIFLKGLINSYVAGNGKTTNISLAKSIKEKLSK